MPTMAKGMPKRAVEANPKPWCMAAPPMAAEQAFETLNAICMPAPPSISPPLENPTIRYCGGPPIPKRQALAMNAKTKGATFASQKI